MKKECYNCKYFNILSDWMCVDYWLLIKESRQKGTHTLGDEDPILKDFAKHGGGQGRVYSVCEKHKFILPENRSDICNDFDVKQIDLHDQSKIKVHGDE